MPLNEDVLGNSLYEKAKQFNDIPADSLDDSRKAFWKGVASEIIAHIVDNTEVIVEALGFVAANGQPIQGTGKGKVK